METNGGVTASTASVRNYAIDALRLVAVCFVIYIHIFEINKGVVYSNSFSWKVIDILFGVSRLAVPVFFAISGWFIFSSERSEQIRKLRKQIVKLTAILLFATIGTAIALAILERLHMVISPLPYLPNVPTLLNVFALGKSPGIAPLWFLVSLIIVELLYLLAGMSFKKDSWLSIPAFIFFAFTLAFSSYRTSVGLPELPFSVNETWLLAFSWFTIGYFLAKNFKHRSDISVRPIIAFTVTSFLLYLYEYILHTSGAPLILGPYNYEAVFLFTPFAAGGILLLAARSNIHNNIIRIVARLGKEYALGVFIIHLVVIQPINALFVKSHLLANDPIPKLIVTYSSVVILSIALTALYYKFKSELHNKPQASVAPSDQTQ